MPELPEVETTRRSIAPALEGRVLASVEVRRDRMARRNQRPSDVVDRLHRRRVASVGRTGKFIVAEVEGDLRWVMHLGMSGRMQLAAPGSPEAPHTNFTATTDAGVELRFVDPRTFGFVAVYTPEEWDASPMPALGPDALDGLPRTPELARRLHGRSAPVKALLLDQRIVAGIGNIYADEILFRARIAPRRAAGSLTTEEVRRLRQAIKPVLQDGLRYGGSSLDDLAYLLPDGRVGEYTARLRAYGRTGEPCPRCGTPIERVVVAQRSSHFCPECQR
ncbi:MAG TPA: bifunctional DNA-formamidopyrimidine glycosylase/DNA-(apurinic or apyrimidinic site) lyase [Acidimicrobiia bacterium]|nr:bifunctional DNA-formamidopyrimidine glycosylase/DNA-(apurinic or apyrimidinic site) lyase [Acidimicrobiia bacterium]